ncbi:hypothetical protein [Rhodoplanes roseus]|uniref:Uncharacterized protein n=1 Tax=Rhodoplanes roseus TaxID=29409 RepID=A0A327KW56_9BRAD|nr:hypothetical protein [Rhodoplanes roseus]RAI43110.1 hypothetical protein CH341_16100 [Rhodoplanes roseus]
MTQAARITPPRALLLLVAGFVVWSSAFVWLYGGLSVGCAFGWDRITLAGTSALRLGLLLIWLVHVAALGWLLAYSRAVRQAGRSPPFVTTAATALTVVALIATVWTGLAIPATTLCI